MKIKKIISLKSIYAVILKNKIIMEDPEILRIEKSKMRAFFALLFGIIVQILILYFITGTPEKGKEILSKLLQYQFRIEHLILLPILVINIKFIIDNLYVLFYSEYYEFSNLCQNIKINADDKETIENLERIVIEIDPTEYIEYDYYTLYIEYRNKEKLKRLKLSESVIRKTIDYEAKKISQHMNIPIVCNRTVKI